MRKKKHRGVFSYKTKKGITYGISYADPASGRMVRKVLRGCRSADEAAKLRSIEIADAERGALNRAYGLKKPKTTPFPAALKAYLQWYSQNRKNADSTRHLSRAILKAFGKKLLSDINPFMVERYKMNRIKQVSKQTGKPISRNTVNQELILLNRIFKKSIQWGMHTGENPMEKVSRFKMPKRKKPGILTADEVDAIREQIRWRVHKDILTFGYATGWRINEILGLRWENVDLESGSAWIIDPKGGNTTELELSDDALEVIRRQPQRSEYVFTKMDGTRFRTVYRAFKSAAERAGIQLPPGKCWHILRASWTTEMDRAGANTETIRQLGNWSDSSMVLYYLQGARSDEKRTLLNRLPSLNCKKTAKSEKVIPLKSHG